MFKKTVQTAQEILHISMKDFEPESNTLNRPTKH